MVAEIIKIFPQINGYLAAFFFVFARLLGFMRFAPVFNRKEIPSLVKLGLAFVIGIILTSILKPAAVGTYDSFILSIFLNFVVGGIIGYMAQLILLAVDAGGDMINMQMGLSSAMVLDPTSGTQVSILTKLIALMGILIFINIGGVYWLFKALLRSFEIFPVYSSAMQISKLANMELLIKLSSNTLYMGLQIAAPILLATLAQDIILGVISRTAPQVNVFTLSFLFKPVIGAAILVWILPMLMNVIEEYFLSFANII